QAPAAASKPEPKKEPFFRTMNAEEYKAFSAALQDAPKPKQPAAAAAAQKIPKPDNMPLREFVMLPQLHEDKPEPVPTPAKSPQPVPPAPEVEQTALEMPPEAPWRMVGELYNTYILVEEGEDAFLIDKHAAHERILFEKLKANQEKISSQALLQPLPVRLSPTAAGELLSQTEMLGELGFEVEEFGENTLLLRQIPMDLSPEDAADALESLASDLLNGRRGSADTVRDELLHTVACKAAIKAGWHSDEKELLAIAEAVMARQDLKYCPHGRPICISLSKKQLEKQFKRT
ncbi:MAG: DNA mismatch repair protein MutL, partial [Candidatus Faecousia sp.]|nr:DNA mismatch repair protein MutL [Candidatus Faecousia sp.]